MAKRISNGDLRQDLHDFREHMDHRLDRVERHIRGDITLATQAEQGAIDDLSAAVETLAADLGGVSGAMQALNDKIAALQAGAAVDAATIADLQTSASDVVGKLAPITARVTGLDADLKSPATPASPLHAN